MPPNASLSATDRFLHQVLWGRYTLRLFVNGELAAAEVLDIENPLKLFGSASSLPNGVLKAVSRVNAKAALEQVRHS